MCCVCKSIGVEVHHIIPQEESGSDTEENAAPLCPTCHETYGANPQKRKFIRETRDHWYELCAKRFFSDPEFLDEIKQLLSNSVSQADLRALKDELFSRLPSQPPTSESKIPVPTPTGTLLPDQQTAVSNREVLLTKSFESLIAEWSEAERMDCSLNRHLLRLATESYFRELSQFKSFHTIHMTAGSWRGAHMVRWLMQFRPIQLKSETGNERALLCNELFAVTVAIRFAGIAPSKIPPQIFESLIHLLHFDAPDVRSWRIILDLLQRFAGDDSTNVA